MRCWRHPRQCRSNRPQDHPHEIPSAILSATIAVRILSATAFAAPPPHHGGGHGGSAAAKEAAEAREANEKSKKKIAHYEFSDGVYLGPKGKADRAWADKESCERSEKILKFINQVRFSQKK